MLFRKKSLCIATPFYEIKAFSPYVDSLVATLQALPKHGYKVDYISVSGDSYIDRARNGLLKRFANQTLCDRLLFVDSDTSWKIDGLLQLLKSPYDLTGVLYRMKGNIDNYCGILCAGDDGVPIGDVKAGLISAMRVPMGFTLISRHCAEFMLWEYNQAPFSYIRTEDGTCMGEDYSFCTRWMNSGGTIWVEPRVSLGHWLTIPVEGCLHDHLLGKE